ncbi:MAG: hypothetical protein HQM11_02905 [SAR324 cluster bacterium]|nr:hypothetical protein [SAR324 cluster bacterium]
MLFLLRISLILLLFSLVGYFIFLNDRNVAIGLFGNYSIHLSLWVVIFSAFAAGIFLAEIRLILFHPDRVVQRFKQRYQTFKSSRQDQLLDEYYDAFMRRDIEKVRQHYGSLKSMQYHPLRLRIHHLESKIFEMNNQQLMNAYYDLRQKFPGNLQVLIPYQKLAISLKEWALVERLSHEISDVVRFHPDSLNGFRLCAESRNDLEQCLHYEQQLLQRFKGSYFAEQILADHEKHLLRYLEQQPSRLKDLKLDYLPNAQQFRGTHFIFLSLGESHLLVQDGQYLKAANLIKKCYDSSGSPVLIDELESLYFLSGKQDKIGSLLQSITQSPNKSAYVDLVLCRVWYKENKIEDAVRQLNTIESDAGKFQAFHALKYLCAVKRQSELSICSDLLKEDELIKPQYECTQCHHTGHWSPVCPGCEQINTIQLAIRH